MELKKDCVRDVLLYLEKNMKYNEPFFANQIELKEYLEEDILYTCEKLTEAYFINAEIHKYVTGDLPTIMITSISYDGHQFLDNIRNESVWKETKGKLKTVGDVSLNIISQIAASIITSKLNI